MERTAFPLRTDAHAVATPLDGGAVCILYASNTSVDSRRGPSIFIAWLHV
jgi:hypothetical protein